MRKSLPVLNGKSHRGTPVGEEPWGEAAASETVASETVGAKMDVLRESLEGQRGARYWRSLEELSGSAAFHEVLRRELPSFAAEWLPSLDRRRFLQVSGASLALAGLTGCTRQPFEKIVPYVSQPEELVPGKPLFYATTMTLGGYATGLLAESHMGRPTKVEGNPEHPASLGGTSAQAQASVLDLYDPDRSQALVEQGNIRTWDKFTEAMNGTLIAQQALGGEGVRILSRAQTSPSLAKLAGDLATALPKARWHTFESAGAHSAAEGSRRAFGQLLGQRYDLAKADVILALDSDFLTAGPGAVRYAKDFGARRKVASAGGAARGMSRLYAVESMPTSTGSAADHRLALAPAEIGRFALALAARLGVAGVNAPAEVAAGDAGKKATQWLEAVAEDLSSHQGTSLVVVGEHASAELHVLAHGINAALGAVGSTVIYSESPELGKEDSLTSLSELIEDMGAGKVDTLLILGANPAYEAPADLDFAAALEQVRVSIHHGTHLDETGVLCHWHVPAAHYLETWTDARAFDGTASVGQPLIEPLYGGKSDSEMVAMLLGRPTATAEELVREAWAGSLGDGSFEEGWRRLLHDGYRKDSSAAAVTPVLNAGALATAAGSLASGIASGMELQFRPDPMIYDGRFANNGWLQECPKPMTKLTWDNALMLSPKTARDLGLGDLVKGDDIDRDAPLVQLTVGERDLELPALVVPGHADGCATLHLGYGRTRCGKVGDGTGFNANVLRTRQGYWHVADGVQVSPAGGTYQLASTQTHQNMEGRNLVRQGDLAGYRSFLDEHGNGHEADHGDGHDAGGHGTNGQDDNGHGGGHKAQYPPVHHHGPLNISLMDGKDFPYDGYAWGMNIDLGACTGCQACVVACQSENNIATVGKEQVALGRELHWIRIDRYYQGESADEVETILHQPVPCQQCEEAPCEVVCPVAATVHSDEGLNDMVYNRCVGTRYCSNNCPYKVRRFNFLLYADFDTPSLQLGRNPDVTVRSRGVMEKCTYCVQRINKARQQAKTESRKIRDGEIVTACQGACPSDAIVFGDVNDPHSAVSEHKASSLDYSLLEELGTRPRTTYLARIRNPNPRLMPPKADGAAEHH